MFTYDASGATSDHRLIVSDFIVVFHALSLISIYTVLVHTHSSNVHDLEALQVSYEAMAKSQVELAYLHACAGNHEDGALSAYHIVNITSVEVVDGAHQFIDIADDGLVVSITIFSAVSIHVLLD